METQLTQTEEQEIIEEGINTEEEPPKPLAETIVRLLCDPLGIGYSYCAVTSNGNVKKHVCMNCWFYSTTNNCCMVYQFRTSAVGTLTTVTIRYEMVY